MKAEKIKLLKNALIVSVQVTDERGYKDVLNPAQGPAIVAAFAVAAVNGGARGIRADGPLDIAAIRRVVDVPIIGIYKIDIPGYDVRITPTLEAAKEIVRAGADIVALDATERPRPNNLSASELIKKVKEELGVPVMADVSTYEEGVKAAESGADLISTALSGYTQYTLNRPRPDLELVSKLAKELDVPIVAEGHYDTPELARRALELGAYAVVVGNMIVNVRRITKRFVEEMSKAYYR
jgi:putative N-acetylmannosamine-6-phosphate epimerase